MTGFSAAVRAIIVEREGGKCARCEHRLGTQIHHRRPRGMGSSKRHNTNTPSAGLWVCDDCHHFIEHNRTIAKRNGWLVEQRAQPAEIPVLYRGEWMLLDDTGCLQPYYERPAERWFCGLMWPSGTPDEPHVCVASPEHSGTCVCACGITQDGSTCRRISTPTMQRSRRVSPTGRH